MPASLLFYPIPTQPTAPGNLCPHPTQSPVLSLTWASNLRVPPQLIPKEGSCLSAPSLPGLLERPLPPTHHIPSPTGVFESSPLPLILKFQEDSVSPVSQGRGSSCFQFPTAQATRKSTVGLKLPRAHWAKLCPPLAPPWQL